MLGEGRRVEVEDTVVVTATTGLVATASGGGIVANAKGTEAAWCTSDTVTTGTGVEWVNAPAGVFAMAATRTSNVGILQHEYQ